MKVTTSEETRCVRVNALEQYVPENDLEKLSESSAKGHTAVVTYADGVTQTLVNVKSIEYNAESSTEGAR